MAKDLTLAMRLLLDAQRFTQGLTNSGSALNRFASRSRSELDRLRGGFNSVQGNLAKIGVSVGATAMIMKSAQLDKSLSQIALTAGAGAGQIETLRDRLFEMSQQTGKGVQDLLGGFNALVQSGLSFDQSLATMVGINQAMAISGASAEVLAQGVTVAARAFEFDLSNPQTALKILEQMTVGGRLGNAELQALAGVFGTVGNSAKAAGMNFVEALALVEGLSMSLPGDPGRLATRSESTLRLFSDMGYLRAAERASGVRFFDADGSRRQTTQVFTDLKKKFDQFATQVDKANFIERAFGMTDKDTRTGLFEILSGGNLAQIKEFQKQIDAASGVFASGMEQALNNSVDQVGRLKATLGEAADGFSRTLNDGISGGIKKLLDSKDKGGFELTGGEIAGGAAAALAATYLARRVAGPMIGGLLGSAGSLAMNVGQAKALEHTVGATLVAVTNWPASFGLGGAVTNIAAGAGAGIAAAKAAKMFGGLRAAAAVYAGTALANLGTLGVGGVAGATAGITGAALTGYTIGSSIYGVIDETSFADKLGAAIARALGALGNDNARASIAAREQLEGSLKIQIDDKRTRAVELKSNSSNFELTVDHNTGYLFGKI